MKGIYQLKAGVTYVDMVSNTSRFQWIRNLEELDVFVIEAL
jgi:hypothetical protein